MYSNDDVLVLTYKGFSQSNIQTGVACGKYSQVETFC
jgi:hypothetical protein